MFSADFSNIFGGELPLTDAPTWAEYGRSGQSFFGGETTGSTVPGAGGMPSAGGGDMYTAPGVQNWGSFLPPVQIGTGGAARADIAAQLRAAQEQALAGADYISDIPGEVGEAAGEFAAELGAGLGAGIQSVLTGATEPITDIPGDLLGDIPIWVPLLAGAFILSR